MNYMNTNKMQWEKKAQLEKHKNAAYYFEQILEATATKKNLDGHLPPISQTIQVW